jgi:hypothetical protein
VFSPLVPHRRSPRCVSAFSRSGFSPLVRGPNTVWPGKHQVSVWAFYRAGVLVMYNTIAGLTREKI